MENYEEYILGWYFDKNNKIIKILINEKFAKTTDVPIFVIVNSVSNNQFDFEKTVDKTITNTINSVRQVIYQYKINYRYERDSRSEYSYKLVYRYKNGTYQLGGRKTLIRKIHKRDIGKMFYNDFNIWQLQYVQNLSAINLVTFEYDWWASGKPVVTFGGIAVKCKMKYLHEYYQRLYIPINQNVTISNSKGYIKGKTVKSYEKYCRNYMFFVSWWNNN